MRVIFQTNIDKFKNKFPTDFKIIPRVGEFVRVEKGYVTPFKELQVIRVTYEDSQTVVVELHLSELQAKQNIQYKMNVFN